MHRILVITIFMACQIFARAQDASPPIDFRSPSRAHFLKGLSSVFEYNKSADLYDIDRDQRVEEDHVKATRRWIEGLVSLSSCPESLNNFVWKHGKQISVLMRSNKIFLSKPAKNLTASLVISNELQKQVDALCKENWSEDKACSKELYEKLFSLTSTFWTGYKEDTEKLYQNAGISSSRVGPGQILAAISKDQDDKSSRVNLAIDDLTQFTKARGDSKNASSCVQKNEIFSPLVKATPKQEHTQTPSANADVVPVDDIVATPEAGKRFSDRDHALVGNRYSRNLIKGLGCNDFDRDSLFNGRLVARLLRRNTSVSTDSLNANTDILLDEWCAKNTANPQAFKDCVTKITPLLHSLNKTYQEDIKAEPGFEPKLADPTTTQKTSHQMDEFFKTTTAKADHPANNLNREIADAVKSLELIPNFKCGTSKEKYEGPYVIEEFDPKMLDIAKSTLDFIRERAPVKSLFFKSSVADISPNRQCLAGIKRGLVWGGAMTLPEDGEDVFPHWYNARDMAETFVNTEQVRKYMSDGYSFDKLPYKNIDIAPPFSYIVYGGSVEGHIEMKVPTWFLKEKGFTYIKAKDSLGNVVDIPIDKLDFAYISDYIDAFPRSHYNSRLASRVKSDNGRPLIGIYQMRRD